MKLVFLILLIFVVCGCATATEQNYKDSLETWVSASEDHLIESWGIPDQTYPMSDGVKLITYNKVNGTVLRWGAAIPVGCKTTFKISASHIVEGYKYEGNACKSKAP